MGRWQPDSRGRLAKAALILFDEQGFDDTTVSEVAAAAGVTERTFFRQFPDKREVLFGGNRDLEAEVRAGIAEADADLAPIDLVAAGLRRAADMLGERRDFARRRARVITANPELRERDLVKNAEMAESLATALRDRGVDETTATLAAEAGTGAFRIALQRWTSASSDTALEDLVQESLTSLRSIVGAA
jgi:AcrR family transcriptional regulator